MFQNYFAKQALFYSFVCCCQNTLWNHVRAQTEAKGAHHQNAIEMVFLLFHKPPITAKDLDANMTYKTPGSTGSVVFDQCVPGRDNMEDRLIKKQWRKGVLVLQGSFRDQCFARFFRLTGNVLNRRPLSSSSLFLGFSVSSCKTSHPNQEPSWIDTPAVGRGDLVVKECPNNSWPWEPTTRVGWASNYYPQPCYPLPTSAAALQARF